MPPPVTAETLSRWIDLLEGSKGNRGDGFDEDIWGCDPEIVDEIVGEIREAWRDALDREARGE